VLLEGIFAQMNCSYTNNFYIFRYGANGQYATKRLGNGAYCNNDVFGDPIENVVKHCDYNVVNSLLYC